MRLDGRTAVVTGASSGIGREIALELARAGARVVATARREELLQALVDEGPGGRVEAVAGDLTDPSVRERLLAAAGDVDVLVNNAGGAWIGDLVDMTAEDVDRMVQLDFVAVVDLCRRVLPSMLERRTGHIVNVGSITGWYAAPPLTVYAAVKAGVSQLTEGLRREVGSREVAVTLVEPAAVRDTEAMDGAHPDGLLHRAFRLTAVPPAEVARQVRFAIEHPRLPGQRTFTVPRAAGVVRLAAVPPVAWTADQVMVGLRRLGVRLA